MAITIQDLLASDTISQAVDKINFNFDQLLLNGGGPIGPAGPIGPSGPIGGRGERGSEWYEGTDNPNVTPPPGITPLEYDKYLQDNGQVWEYTGLTWSDTGINLTGPQGTSGTAIGWSQFGNDGNGNYQLIAKNVSYPAIFTGDTITPDNQGVPVAAFGIASPNDTSVDNKFKLSSEIAGALDSSVLSVLIRQGSSTSNAIKFMGSGDSGGNYEQLDLDNLSSISLGTDDTLSIIVPKQGTAGDSNQYVGYIVEVEKRGYKSRTGNGMSFETGTKGTAQLGGDNSNVTFTLNQLAAGGGDPTFTVNTIGTLSQTQTQIGPVVGPLTTNPSYTGGVRFDVDTFGVAANNNIGFLSGDSITGTVGTNLMGLETTKAYINTTVNPIDIKATGGGDIEIFTSGGGETYIDSTVKSVISVNQQPSPGVGSSIEQTTGSMTLTALGTDADHLKIKSDSNGKGIAIGLGQNNVTGKIRIGRAFQTNDDFLYNAGITLNYVDGLSGVGDQKGLINVTGRVAFMLQGENLPATRKSTVFFDNSPTFYESPPAPLYNTPIIVAHGSDDQGLNPGVVQSAWYFGNTILEGDSGSFYIGKGYYDGLGSGPGPAGSQRGGIFLNDSQEFIQGAPFGGGPGVDAEGYNPPGEKFKVDQAMTKVSNKMIWGGKHGISAGSNTDNSTSGFKYDCFLKDAPANTTLHATSPFLRVVIGPIDANIYTQANLDNETIYDPSDSGSTQTTTFTLEDPPSDWAAGQRLHVELFVVSSAISIGSNLLKANPKIDLKYTQRIVGGEPITYTVSSGSPSPSVTPAIGAPKFIRCNFTLQWSGFNDEYYTGFPEIPGLFTAYDFTPGWSLIGTPIYQDGNMDNAVSPHTYANMDNGSGSSQYNIEGPN